MYKTELRLNPLTQAWTIFSESRALPPAYQSVLAETGKPNALRAGLEHLAPHTLYEVRNPNGWQVRVVPNRLPALRVEGDATRQSDGFYDHLDGVGAHEIIIEDPGSQRFEDLPIVDMEKVILAWQARINDLRRDTRLVSFTIVKDVGAATGAQMTQSISQLLAMAVVPSALANKLYIAREFFETKRRSIFADILGEELRTGERVIEDNGSFVTFCPYSSRVPFEMAIWPKRQHADFNDITPVEIRLLANALRLALTKLNSVLDYPAYHFSLVTAPTPVAREGRWPTVERDFRWHVEILPRLYPANGIEIATGSHVNCVWPETAAKTLCAMEVFA